MVTNLNRTAIRIVLPPGQMDRTLDFEWHSSKDTHWQRLLEHCGGKDAVKARIEAVSPPLTQYEWSK